MKITFSVQGSEEYPYTVSFNKSDDGLIATCDCNAALNGMHCKHRLRILQGSREGIISKNLDKVEIVKSWYPGSSIETAVIDLEKAEEEFKTYRNKIHRLKTNVAICLLGKNGK